MSNTPMVETVNTKQIESFALFVRQTSDNCNNNYLQRACFPFSLVMFNYAQVFPTANHLFKSLYLVNIELYRRVS